MIRMSAEGLTWLSGISAVCSDRHELTSSVERGMMLELDSERGELEGMPSASHRSFDETVMKGNKNWKREPG
ncbi:hypothetical protein K469DRAFT_708884 [Zopfia rhizophila CBS 207.26]|uniref:Uncharacterized protein n=1 Tax=Zopfia rhizophila CBS 207.26 TaxID=1314779 RepID=A0A6A6E289_9PEZI|nr:hypothetical protein K469DRAFT_708884 [Zopfia rhizophila CBS 207.26]